MCQARGGSKHIPGRPIRAARNGRKSGLGFRRFGYLGDMSTTPSIATGPRPSDGRSPTEEPSAWETVYPDDVWPLEAWLSREDGFVDDDTWHAGRARRWFLFR